MNSHMILNRFYQPLEILLNIHYDRNGTQKMGSWAAPTSIIFPVPSFLQLLGSQISSQFQSKCISRGPPQFGDIEIISLLKFSACKSKSLE